jgi:hypothetical protein
MRQASLRNFFMLKAYQTAGRNFLNIDFFLIHYNDIIIPNIDVIF